MEFKLRLWDVQDLESLVEYANNANIAKFMMDKFPHPYTKEAGEQFINYAVEGNPTHIFAIEVEGKAAGGIGIHPLADVESKNAEMGYWLAETYWGHGIITNAIKQMINYGFSNFDINRIFARPFGTNVASQKVLQKAGFILEATLEKLFLKMANTWMNWCLQSEKNNVPALFYRSIKKYFFIDRFLIRHVLKKV